jgi:hypothetical protein
MLQDLKNIEKLFV